MAPSSHTEFRLSDSERNSALWQKLAAHFDQRLRELRVQNDFPMPLEDRYHLLGRIAQLKDALALAQQPEYVTPVRSAFAVS